MKKHTERFGWEETGTRVIEGDLVQTLRRSGNFKKLLKALEDTGLDEVLAGEGPYTLFAPPDSAFTALPRSEWKALRRDQYELKRVLLYHVSAGEILAEDFPQTDSIETLEGSALAVQMVDSEVLLDEAHVTAEDIDCTNGVIHVLDKVNVPTRK